MSGYIVREAQAALEEMLGQFKVVLVTGARQVGKTTMLKEMLGRHYHYVSLDPPRTRALAQDDPLLFLKDHKPPVIIDEVQKAPMLFDQIKALVDASDVRGAVVLTGSQTLHLMEGISESLAGRVGIIHLPTLSLRELTGNRGRGVFVPTNDAFLQPTSVDVDIWHIIRQGTYPELYDRGSDWERFFSAYVQTYIERDVRSVLNVKDEELFVRFITACAARTGQLVNFSELGSEIGVSHKTAQNWISVLRASGLIFLLRPFSTNASKRLVKMPKLYFMDTGLASYLLGWSTDRTLREGAMAGPMFETFAITEVLKSYLNDGRATSGLSFYRDNKGCEIDLLIQRQETLHPVEVKKSASPRRDAVRAFSRLEGLPNVKRGEGAVICLTDEPYSLSEIDRAIPIQAI